MLLLAGVVSCRSANSFYHAEHEDNFNLKQSKEIIRQNNRYRNERYARKRQEKIQATNNSVNYRTAKTRQTDREKGAVPH